jgi:hypothetical protein
MAREKKSKTTPADAMREFLARGREGKLTYMLRCCDSQRRAYGGFTWPDSGPVEAPDWMPANECGQGLHGWLMGAGDVGASSNHSDPDAVWLVCVVFADDAIDLNGKIKVPRAWVVFAGSRSDAVQRTVDLGSTGVVYSTLTGGDGSTLTGGDGSTLTGGDGGAIAIKRWNGKHWRLEVAHVGEDGIEPNRPYRLDTNGCFVRADKGGDDV